MCSPGSTASVSSEDLLEMQKPWIRNFTGGPHQYAF